MVTLVDGLMRRDTNNVQQSSKKQSGCDLDMNTNSQIQTIIVAVDEASQTSEKMLSSTSGRLRPEGALAVHDKTSADIGEPEALSIGKQESGTELILVEELNNTPNASTSRSSVHNRSTPPRRSERPSASRTEGTNNETNTNTNTDRGHTSNETGDDSSWNSHSTPVQNKVADEDDEPDTPISRYRRETDGDDTLSHQQTPSPGDNLDVVVESVRSGQGAISPTDEIGEGRQDDVFRKLLFPIPHPHQSDDAPASYLDRRTSSNHSATSLDSRIALEIEAARRKASSVISELTLPTVGNVEGGSGGAAPLFGASPAEIQRLITRSMAYQKQHSSPLTPSPAMSNHISESTSPIALQSRSTHLAIGLLPRRADSDSVLASPTANSPDAGPSSPLIPASSSIIFLPVSDPGGQNVLNTRSEQETSESLLDVDVENDAEEEEEDGAKPQTDNPDSRTCTELLNGEDGKNELPVSPPGAVKEGGSDDEREKDPVRGARFPYSAYAASSNTEGVSDFKSLSITESDVGSTDGLPQTLRSDWQSSLRESMLKRIDGVNLAAPGVPRRSSTKNDDPIQLRPSRYDISRSHGVVDRKASPAKDDDVSFFSMWPLDLFSWGSNGDEDASGTDDAKESKSDANNSVKKRMGWKNDDDSFSLLSCANIIHPRQVRPPAVSPSLLRVAGLPSYAETFHREQADPRMNAWAENQFNYLEKSAVDGSYQLGKSRTVVVHEICRGDWTWCTAWSPDGSRLAVGTENHDLAVIETTSSTVWRVKYDRKIKGPRRAGMPHSIRSISWGDNYIAIGGTGNGVSILSPAEPYELLHTIQGTGFVGSLDWKVDSTDLVIGSRMDKAMVFRLRSAEDFETNEVKVESELLYTIDRKDWVHGVSFSPGGSCLAVGDAGGHLLVYKYRGEYDCPVDVRLIKEFKLDDAILDVEWSPDGAWLYAGGEDYTVSVIDTRYWEIVHRIKRDRWVQCVAACKGGSHVAVGGVSSEISLLDVSKGWDSVMGIELKGLVPLSATWHPNDQYLALTGQNNSIIVVETTNARHVKGHHLHSISSILAVEFSPDGRMAVVGNQDGIVTFFSLSGSTFVTNYELFVSMNDRLSIQWSLNGLFIVIGSKDSVFIVARKRRDREGKVPPKASGFSVRKVIQDFVDVNAVSIDAHSQYVAISGKGTRILDATTDFRVVREWKSGPCYANAWSPDGKWLATIGADKVLTIYDTSEERLDRWRSVFAVSCSYTGRALAWCPVIIGGLLYIAYAGDGKEITVMEIRTREGTWETILRVQRPGTISSLDWNADGLLAAGLSNGTVSIVDLAYLMTGVAVNEMDYNWQRQALTCFTEIRRNRGRNSMKSVRWIPSAPGSDSLLAVGGSDGELEIIDLTERNRCRGYTPWK